MQKFKDALGREWGLRIKLPDIDKMRSVGCDLDKLCDGNGEKFFDAYLSLPLAVKVAAVWELCRGQHDVNEEGFAEGFDGETLEAASIAFMKAVVDFFRKPVMVRLMENLHRILETAGKVMDKKIEMSLLTLSESAGDSPAKSESTHAS